jgi:hypothetical protein
MRQFLLILPLLTLLGSCGTSLLERKYRPGFYHERKGDHTVVVKQAAEEPAVRDERAKTAKVVAGSTICAEKPIPGFTTASLSAHDTVRRKDLPGDTELAPAPQKRAAPPDTADEQEEKEIKTTFRYALLATGLFVLLWLVTIFLVSASFFAFFMLVSSFVFAMVGFMRARKIRERHLPGDDYPGKKKVVFAIVVGWVYMILVAGSLLAGIIGIGILLFSLYR